MRDKRALIKIQQDKDASDRQSRYHKDFQIFNYAVASFTNLIGEEAASKNDAIDSNFHGLPLNIDTDKPEIIGDIKFTKKSDYDFQIQLNGSGSDSEITLRISGFGAQFVMNSKGGGISMPNFNSGFSLSDVEYKKPIDEAFGYLIIYLDDKASNTKN
jgi:hypothetical protein